MGDCGSGRFAVVYGEPLTSVREITVKPREGGTGSAK